MRRGLPADQAAVSGIGDADLVAVLGEDVDGALDGEAPVSEEVLEGLLLVDGFGEAVGVLGGVARRDDMPPYYNDSVTIDETRT